MTYTVKMWLFCMKKLSPVYLLTQHLFSISDMTSKPGQDLAAAYCHHLHAAST